MEYDKRFWSGVLVALTLLLGLVGLQQAAFAHGPSRQKVQESVEVSASPATVWAVVGDFQAAHTWMPMVESSEGEGGSEEGATRTLHLAGGGEVHEYVKRRDDERMRLTYRIPMDTHDVNVLPVTNYSSTIMVAPNANGGSTVTWRGAFYRGYPNNDPPEKLNDAAAVRAVTGVYEASLANLKRLLEAG